MTVVDGIDSYLAKFKAEDRNQRMEDVNSVMERLEKDGQTTVVMPDVFFKYPTGHERRGFYIDQYLKDNFDNYLIRAVAKKWDGLFIVTGMEGSGKSTSAFAYAKYLDPSFPGRVIKEGASRRHCDRIVFTQDQFFTAVEEADIGQAIVFDEAILGLMAGDAGSAVQKMIIKKLVTIRKKRLYIILVIPSIFALRMQIATQRARFMIHFYSPDGIERGFFKFYSYATKRKLYHRGRKEWDQDAVPADFSGRASDTSGLFFDENEYENKKDRAISDITSDKKDKGSVENYRNYLQRCHRDLLLYYLYSQKENEEKQSPKKFKDWIDELFGDHLRMSEPTMRTYLQNGLKYLQSDPNPLDKKARGDEENEDI